MSDGHRQALQLDCNCILAALRIRWVYWKCCRCFDKKLFEWACLLQKRAQFNLEFRSKFANFRMLNRVQCSNVSNLVSGCIVHLFASNLIKSNGGKLFVNSVGNTFVSIFEIVSYELFGHLLKQNGGWTVNSVLLCMSLKDIEFSPSSF